MREASRAVLADYAGGSPLDLFALAKENEGAFGVSVLWRAYAGSTRLYHEYAVFVVGSTNLRRLSVGAREPLLRAGPDSPDVI
jgi:hypothetical protein